MLIKFAILNERLKWYKKRSLFAKWAIQNNSDTLAATRISEKTKMTQLEFILAHSL